MKKASVRFVGAVLAMLMLCAIAGCAPGTENTDGSTEALAPSRPPTVVDPTKTPTEDQTEIPTDAPTDAPTEDANSGILYENSFDSAADLDGWKDMPATIPEGSYAKINEAGQLEIYAATKDATGKTYALNGYTGKVTFEVDITCSFLETVTGNRTSGAIMVFADNSPAVCFYFYPEGFGYYNVDKEPSPGVTIFGICNSDQTYHMTINADTETDTYDVYVDGELILENAGFRNTGEKFNKIQLSSGGNSVGVTLKYDDLKIYTTQD